MKCFSLFFVLLFSVACQQMPLVDEGPSTFSSTFIGTDIPYAVHLPDLNSQQEEKKSHENGQKTLLDLLVLLDGQDYFGTAANVNDLYHFAEVMRPTMIVSLPSTMETRWRDYTPTVAQADNDGTVKDSYQHSGGFEAFADFLEKELIPHLEQTFQCQFEDKALFGHSLGGLGVLSFFVLRPAIFDHYICASPSTMYDQHYIFKELEKREQLTYQKFFLTVAGAEPNGYISNHEWLSEYLNDRQQTDQQFSAKMYAQDQHATSGIQSLIDGMRFLAE
ncbi:MAG: alpha/beta hydrolase-fold protein [Bacteroidota bacterium]